MKDNKIRYAVVGLGHIAQVAALPAFKNCKKSQLTALVSTDPQKLKVLSRKYNIKPSHCFKNYSDCLRSGAIDGVYLTLPNHLHKTYTVEAAQSGIHILCEKPMAVSVADCEEMIKICKVRDVKLMIAYRLHFEAANLKAIQFIHEKNRIGDPRIFQSTHSQVTNYPNIRTLPTHQGGGPTYDIGIYDINAARYIFQDEPISVFAACARLDKPEFKHIEEAMSVILRFPHERLASIIYSFGASSTDTFRVAGTRGDLQLTPAYTYKGEKKMSFNIEGKKTMRTFPAHDHFSSEIDYFSDCILNNLIPEPSGMEGFADIRIIEGIYASASQGKLIELTPIHKELRPSIQQLLEREAIKPPEVFHATEPTRKKAA